LKTISVTWEMVPSTLLGNKDIWAALLPHMPITALIRSLARMTANGTLMPLSQTTKDVCNSLANEKYLSHGKVHPITILNALKAYSNPGTGKSKLNFQPITQIRSALEHAFGLSFANVTPSGMNFMLALDVSGSMGWPSSAGENIALTAREITAATAMITARKEENFTIFAYQDKLTQLDITPDDSLTNIIQKTNKLPFGGTDCSLPFQYAMDHKIPVDVFVSYTDNETNSNTANPTKILNRFRQAVNPSAKSIVVATTSTGFSIADPNDMKSIDIAGFDTAVPQFISDFSRQ
jgi:60 kDa SS-A/Ro ribonucleoprotein